MCKEHFEDGITIQTKLVVDRSCPESCVSAPTLQRGLCMPEGSQGSAGGDRNV